MINLPKFVFKFVGFSFLLWVLLSTAIPQVSLKLTNKEIQTNKFLQSTYPYNSITSPSPLPIADSDVYYIIGHPDDEVMFFAPSLLEISKKKHNNRVHLVCFSKGNAVDPSMGVIRSEELRQSARILGVKESDVIVLDGYADGMNVLWDAADIGTSLSKIVKEPRSVLITFDEQGVSNHPNHISLYHGVRSFYENYLKRKSPENRLFVLKSLNFWEKYSFTLLTNVELLVDLISKHFLSNILKLNVNVSFFNQIPREGPPTIRFYSDLNMLSVSYAAMAYGHFSQMVWFRYGWLLFSRYLTYNNLIQVK